MTISSPHLCALLAALSLPGALVALDFEADVRPVFDKHCISCHGPDKQKAGLAFHKKRLALCDRMADGATAKVYNRVPSVREQDAVDDSPRGPQEATRVSG